LVLIAGLAPEAKSFGAYATWWNGDGIDNGGGFGAKWKFISLPFVGADVRASWVHFGDAELNVVPLEATGLVDIGLVYGGLGFGYYIFDDADNAGGTYALLGGKLALAGLGVFGEFKYTWVEPKVDEIKFKASGPGINVGVLLGW
jgi:hypothetical protein